MFDKLDAVGKAVAGRVVVKTPKEWAVLKLAEAIQTGTAPRFNVGIETPPGTFGACLARMGDKAEANEFDKLAEFAGLSIRAERY